MMGVLYAVSRWAWRGKLRAEREMSHFCGPIPHFPTPTAYRGTVPAIGTMALNRGKGIEINSKRMQARRWSRLAGTHCHAVLSARVCADGSSQTTIFRHVPAA